MTEDERRSMKLKEREVLAMETIARNSAAPSTVSDRLKQWWNPDPSSSMRIRY